MGNILEYTFLESRIPSTLPKSNEPPTFDPQYGFPDPRKERVMKITEEELKALQVKKELRDYCSHLLPDYFDCTRRKAPFMVLCKPELHAYHSCLYDDYVLRMKEYEREKRLRLRKAQEAAA